MDPTLEGAENAPKPDHTLRSVLLLLVAVARAAWNVADNCEEDMTTQTLTVMESDFRELEKALDALDELPEPGSNIVGTGPAKASAFLGLDDPGQQFVGSNDLKRGIWFQAAVSGLYYRNAQACGEVSKIVIDGRVFRPIGALAELQPGCPRLTEPVGPVRRFCRELDRKVTVESCPMQVECQRLAGQQPDPNDHQCPLDYGRSEPAKS